MELMNSAFNCALFIATALFINNCSTRGVEENNKDELPPCVRYVNIESAEGYPDGLSWGTAFQSVQEGIDSAFEVVADLWDEYKFDQKEPEKRNCEVWVAAGVYKVYNGDIEDKIMLMPMVPLFGGFKGNERYRRQRDWDLNETVLDGARNGQRACHVVSALEEYDHRYIDMRALNRRIDGFTITGGDASRSECRHLQGGAIHTEGSSLLVENCLIKDNLAGSGGGLSTDTAQAIVVRNSEFISNQAERAGGAIAIGNVEDVIIEGCKFISNRSAEASGGAIWSIASLSIENSNFMKNVCAQRYSGGGISAAGYTYVNRCVFTENEGGVAGGIGCEGSSVSVSNSLFLANRGWPAGGIGNYRGKLWVANSTFVQNMGTWGGAVVQWGQQEPPYGTTIINSILWGNGLWEPSYDRNDNQRSTDVLDGPEVNDDETDPTENEIVIMFSNIKGGYPGDHNIAQNPLFEDPQQGNYLLRQGSPCIDAGIGILSSEADLLGNNRVNDPRSKDTGMGPPWADIGAYEYQPK